ncbi:MAG: chromate efflux transporter [Rhodocyclaceae bacterium]|nr:chromate efflux transporter [Rhodocyclaceae bacterium]
MKPSPAAVSPPTFREALAFWVKLGFISFGGPAGQIALMHEELVDRRRWISEKRFLHALNYCMLLPGPEAIQLAIYIGWLMHGVKGALAAGVTFLLPAFFLLSLLAALYLAFGETPLVAALFAGIRPAVVAIVVFAAWRIGAKTLHNGVLAAIALLAFVGIFFFKIGFPWIVLSAALIGALGGSLVPSMFRGGKAHEARAGTSGAAVIDDDTPPPAHARFSFSRWVVTTCAFIGLGGILLGMLDGVLREMAELFTKAAFLTFGGAYAVLPYLYQAAVEQHHWLTGPQMIDGLALGEATPGPLIMVVTWIGYIAGVTHAVLPDPILAGCAGAMVATFFTFLPSFWFILAGAPLIEASRHELRLTAPLVAISAAIVGVIAHLALFFAWHTFWPHARAEAPFSGPFDAFAALIALGAFVALWKYKVEVVKVIGACALLGLMSLILR